MGIVLTPWGAAGTSRVRSPGKRWQEMSDLWKLGRCLRAAGHLFSGDPSCIPARWEVDAERRRKRRSIWGGWSESVRTAVWCLSLRHSCRNSPDSCRLAVDDTRWQKMQIEQWGKKERLLSSWTSSKRHLSCVHTEQCVQKFVHTLNVCRRGDS